MSCFVAAMSEADIWQRRHKDYMQRSHGAYATSWAGTAVHKLRPSPLLVAAERHTSQRKDVKADVLYKRFSEGVALSRQ